MPRRCASRQPILANITDSTESDYCAETDNVSLVNKSLCTKRRRGNTSSNAKSRRSSDCNDCAIYSSSQAHSKSRNWTKNLKQSNACNSKDPVSSDEATPLDKQQLFNSTPTPNAKHDKRLLVTFFDQPCVELARNLLGKNVVRISPDGKRLSGRIVETEGYIGTEDRASHSYGGRRTARNEAMYMPPGTSYVYNIYGIYTCMNISSRGKQLVYPVVTFLSVKSNHTYVLLCMCLSDIATIGYTNTHTNICL